MVISELTDPLVKSAERVQDLGEVLTPPETVKAMLDGLPRETWTPHPSKTFFEPGCGDGNFLVEVLERKLQRLSDAFRKGTLPAGSDREALQFHALEALASIYGVDICAENILGGKSPGELGARARLLGVITERYESITREQLEAASAFLTSARWIVDRNLIVADMLAHHSRQSTPEISLVEYGWDANVLTVNLRRTSLSEVMAEVTEEAAGMLSLSRLKTTDGWIVHPLKLSDVPIKTARIRRQRARNGEGWRAS